MTGPTGGLTGPDRSGIEADRSADRSRPVGLDALFATPRIHTNRRGVHVDDEGNRYGLLDVAGESTFVQVPGDAPTWCWPCDNGRHDACAPSFTLDTAQTGHPRGVIVACGCACPGPAGPP